MTLVLIFLSVSAVRPKWGVKNISFSSNMTDVVFVLDMSSSMNAADIKPSRLDRAKYEIINFVKRTENIRVALVVFAASNFIASPLTYDKDYFISLLNSLSSNSLSIQGTRIADAIQTAENVFTDDEPKRSLIVITDGEEHGLKNAGVIEKLREMNITVYGVSIGTKGGSAIPNLNSAGIDIGYKKTKSGIPIVSKREDVFLENISKQTGGEFYVSENGSIPFGKIYGAIKNRAMQKPKEIDMRYYIERYQIFVLLAAVFILLEIILSLITPFLLKKRVI